MSSRYDPDSLRPLNHQQEVTAARQEHAHSRFEAADSYAVKSRTHLWSVLVQHVAPDALLDAHDGRPGDQPVLDADSIIGRPMLGCYVCEQVYEPRLRLSSLPWRAVVTRCPTPAKKAYPSRNAARRGVRNLYRNRRAGPGRLHTYRCPSGAHYRGRRTNSKAAGGGMAPTVGVSVTRPAPTLTSKSGAQWKIRPDWTRERPATTVVASFCPDVIAAPGYRTTESRQDAEGSVVVTVAEAGLIQSFPPDYPWQGNKGQQYQQVGNAVPPQLAAHVLASITGREYRA